MPETAFEEERALFVARVLGTETLIDVLVRAGALPSRDSRDAVTVARRASQPLIQQLEEQSDASRAELAHAIANHVPDAIAQLVEATPGYATAAETATVQFEEGRHAEATGIFGQTNGLVLTIAFALSLLTLVGKLEVDLRGGTDEPFRWEIREAPGIPKELVTLVDATGRAIAAAAYPGKVGPTSRLPRRESAGRKTAKSPPLETKDQRPPLVSVSLPFSALGGTNPHGIDHDRAVAPDDDDPSRHEAGNVASAAPFLTAFEAPLIAGDSFTGYREKRRVPLKVAREARDALVDLTSRPEFRRLDPWQAGAVRGKPAKSDIEEARWSVGLVYQDEDSGPGPPGFRCVLRVQLPFFVRQRLLSRVTEALNERFGHFVSFRWSGPVTAPSGGAWIGAREGFRIGASLGIAHGGTGGVGLLLRSARGQYYAVTAGHLACGPDGVPLASSTASSPALADGDDRRTASGVLDRVSVFPEWRVGLPADAKGESDLALVHINDAGHIPKNRLNFDRRRAKQEIFRARVSDLPQGLPVAKASAASRFQEAEITASDIAVEIQDRSGLHRWGTGLVEITFSDGSPGIVPGDSGTLALVANGSYVPLGIVVARARAKLLGHDSAARPVAYVQPLYGDPLVRRLKVF